MRRSLIVKTNALHNCQQNQKKYEKEVFCKDSIWRLIPNILFFCHRCLRRNIETQTSSITISVWWYYEICLFEVERCMMELNLLLGVFLVVFNHVRPSGHKRSIFYFLCAQWLYFYWSTFVMLYRVNFFKRITFDIVLTLHLIWVWGVAGTTGFGFLECACVPSF